VDQVRGPGSTGTTTGHYRTDITDPEEMESRVVDCQLTALTMGDSEMHKVFQDRKSPG
jgi:hypothetical protein